MDAIGTRCCSAPRVGSLQQAVKVAAGNAEQFGETVAVGGGIGRFGRAAGRGLDAAQVGDRRALAKDLHGEVPHRLEAERQAGEILGAQAAQPGCRALDFGDRVRDIDPFQVLLDGGRVGLPAARAPGLPDTRGGRVAIGGRQWRVAEPGVGDKAAGAGGGHHVAAPQGVDADYGVAKRFFKGHAGVFPFLMEPNQT